MPSTMPVLIIAAITSRSRQRYVVTNGDHCSDAATQVRVAPFMTRILRSGCPQARLVQICNRVLLLYPRVIVYTHWNFELYRTFMICLSRACVDNEVLALDT